MVRISKTLDKNMTVFPMTSIHRFLMSQQLVCPSLMHIQAIHYSAPLSHLTTTATTNLEIVILKHKDLHLFLLTITFECMDL